MTDDMMALRELPQKGSDASFLREMIDFAAQRLMELDADGTCGAGHGERSPERVPVVETVAKICRLHFGQGKASILALICSSCAALCTRALPACGRSSATGRSAIFAAIQGRGIGMIR